MSYWLGSNWNRLKGSWLREIGWRIPNSPLWTTPLYLNGWPRVGVLNADCLLKLCGASLQANNCLHFCTVLAQPFTAVTNGILTTKTSSPKFLRNILSHRESKTSFAPCCLTIW